MAKIDLEKLICSLAKRKYFSKEKLQGALKEQGLEYKDGEIVESQRPKFKVGDWVIDKQGIAHQIANVVENVTNHIYGYDIVGGGYFNDNMEGIRLWTIQDAKDGDVLALISGQCIFLFDGNNKEYCHYSKITDNFSPNYNYMGFIQHQFVPATKEQRELLFQKMKEAGYEWDAEKKELKKIDNRFDYEHANIQQKDFAPKAITANRQLYNRAILKILSDYIEKYPDIRFGQMLCNLGISSEAENNFYIESSKTYQDINTILKEQDGKNRVI